MRYWFSVRLGLCWRARLSWDSPIVVGGRMLRLLNRGSLGRRILCLYRGLRVFRLCFWSLCRLQVVDGWVGGSSCVRWLALVESNYLSEEFYRTPNLIYLAIHHSVETMHFGVISARIGCCWFSVKSCFAEYPLMTDVGD